MIPDVRNLRIPVKYLANMLTAGKEEPIIHALERMIAIREYMRARTVDGVNATEILDRVGLDEVTLDDMYRIMALANYEDRYVIPTNHREYAGRHQTDSKQLLAMTAGGIFGVTCLIGMVLLIRRRLSDPRIRATSQLTDLPILLLLFVQLVLGLITIPFSTQHLDGSSMIALANWAQHVVTFQGDAAAFVGGESFIFKIHIVLGLTIFLVFPFTRLVHVWSVPVQYLTRSGYQIVRKRG